MASGKYMTTSPIVDPQDDEVRPGKPKSTLATVINSLDKLVSVSLKEREKQTTVLSILKTVMFVSLLYLACISLTFFSG